MKRRDLLVLLAAGAGTSLGGGLAALAQDATSRSVSVREAYERAKAGQSVLIDIRRPDEWADTGVAPGAIRLDMTSPAFEARLAAIRAENPGKPIDLICRTANRSRQVQDALAKRGWRDLVNVRGGMLGDGRNPGWLAENLPVETVR